jgi:dihydropyrimidinase
VAVGSDADLIVFDPNEEQIIGVQTHHMRVDYSMFEGTRVKGTTKTVLSRGRTIIDNGRFTGKAGAGEFLRRENPAKL